jgi:hypothetical protein
MDAQSTVCLASIFSRVFMRPYFFSSIALAALLGAANTALAKDSEIVLVSIKAHPANESAHVCKVVKADADNVSDCNDPKCSSGGAAVDAVLASRNMKRVCKTIVATVNRGYDITYNRDGEKIVTWTYEDPEPILKKIGLVPFEEHTPLNPLCAQMSFKEASAIKECTDMQ